LAEGQRGYTQGYKDTLSGTLATKKLGMDGQTKQKTMHHLYRDLNQPVQAQKKPRHIMVHHEEPFDNKENIPPEV
jgi:hypothetical protein